MATNLVSTILQSFSPDVVGKLAATLGLEESSAQKGIAAAVPGLLASLANAVSGPGGAQKISAAISHAGDITDDSGDIVKSALDSGRGVLETGWGSISSLLGNNAIEKLLSAVAQYAGLSQGSAKKLIAFLVPIVLAFLKREQESAGLNAKGLASFLGSQKSNIERAIPEGLIGRLADSGVRQPSPETRWPGRETTPATGLRRTAASPSPSRSSQSWAYWLVPALIIAGAALYLLPVTEDSRTAQEINRNTKAAGEQAAPKETAQTETLKAKTAAPGGSTAVTLQDDILSNIGRLQTALQTIKDPASAQAAVGEIREISDRFARLKSVAQQLSPEARKSVAAAVSARMPDLNTILDRIGNEINLSGEAKPAMDTLKVELANLTKA